MTKSTNNKWEAFANNFEENNNYVVGIEDIMKVKKEVTGLKNTGRILELGCGNGTYTESLLNESTSIVATDLSEQMVSITEKRFSAREDVCVEQADCFHLSYSDNSFDTVFMANLLHVIPEPEKALEECFRVLKRGGRLVVLSFTLHGMSFCNKLSLKYRYTKTYGSKSSSTTVMTPLLAETLAISVGFKQSIAHLIGEKVKAVYLVAMKE